MIEIGLLCIIFYGDIMIILFAPAKTFEFNANQMAEPNYQFKKETMQLMNRIKKLPKTAFLSLFKLPPSKSDDTFKYYHAFQEQLNYQAMSFYKGEAFKALDFPAMSLKQQQYLNEKTFIIDAFYGIIKPLDGIKPYRLDFTISLDLKSFWKEPVNTFFRPYEKEPILSLASKEFSSILDKNRFDVYEVSFLDCKDNQCKSISVFNKQMRGHLLNHVTKHELDRIEDLPQTFLGYTLEKEEKQLMYKRSID